MVTEETGLNHYLEERGIRVVETDLGEWIQQLAHERPSHMIMPGDPHGPLRQRRTCSTKATGQQRSRTTSAGRCVRRGETLRRDFLRAGSASAARTR